MTPKTKALIVILGLCFFAAVGVVGVIALIVATSRPDTGVRFQAYAGRCPMDVTFTIGTYSPVNEKNAIGPKDRNGTPTSWQSENYEVPSGTKLSMKATAPCKGLYPNQPQCEIRYKGKKLVNVPATGNAACAAAATVP